MTTPAIETDGLTKRFRLLGTYRDLLLYPWRRSSLLAVDRVSLRIEEGELFGLLGENGAGKTTLIRMLSTSLLPSEGMAAVAGLDVVRDPQRVRRLIGLVSGDERSFYWRLTGRQNLEYFAALYHIPRHRTAARIDELIETLGVAAHAGRPFNGYSAGTRQRFAIARGLLTDPNVLFLDEPTRSLDPIAADELRHHVKEHIVGRMGRTVLLATHTLSEAQSICSRVGIIRHGRLVAVGSVPELRRRSQLASVLDLALDAAPVALVARIERMPGVEHVRTVTQPDATHLEVEHDDRDGTVEAVLRAALDCSVHVRSCTSREPDLAAIYRAVHATGSSHQEAT
jgi:ABC-2 type transport system ATP-binding protein